MSVRKVYKCELCFEELDPERLVGLKRETFAMAIWKEERPEATTRHICKECATAIRIIMESKRR